MSKLLFIIAMLIGVCQFAFGQNINRAMAKHYLSQLRESKPDSNRINLLMEVGKFHIYKPGEVLADLDSGYRYLVKAKHLSDSLRLPKWRRDSESMIAIYYMERGDTLEAKSRFSRLLLESRKAGDKRTEATARFRMGLWLSRDGARYQEMLDHYQKALSLYREIKDEEQELRLMRGIAYIHINEGKLNLAEKELHVVEDRYKALGYTRVHYVYNLLSTVNRLKGDFDRALYYAIQCVETMKATGDTVSAASFYGDLARMYHEIGNREKSIEWYTKSLDKWRSDRLPNFALFMTANFIIRDKIAHQKARDGLDLITELVREIPPNSFIQKAIIAQTLAYCYDALQDHVAAEKYLLEAHQWYSTSRMDFEASQELYVELGRFYLKRKAYTKAGRYLNQALDFYPQKNSLASLKDIHFMLYKVDSAQGNYLSALAHFGRCKALNDSIFNETKSRQIEELQIQYETVKKEKDIQLLHERSKLQESQLEKANMTRNITLISILLLVAILILVYNQYRVKKKNNEAMGQKNKVLSQLVDEKEWLLKEIHHRVKNNLQTVVSLLESQSVFLENDALAAIQNSQNRVYAMSLIHQKLYQASNLKTVDMSVYLPDLVNYLSDSFDVHLRIRFKLEIEPIELDVSKAIRLGLIMNEAITNAIKHAFSGTKDNEIMISMKYKYNGHVELHIADNGIGLPAEFRENNSSLGMKLMKGLTEDLRGTLTITSEGGTRITVSFPADLHIIEEDKMILSRPVSTSL